LEQRHINDLKRLYPAVAHHLPCSVDPSRGGHGAAMGNKKAKMEYKKNMVDTEKNQRMDRIEQHIAKQTKQQEELQQVFKLRQLMKLAKEMKNQRLFNKVEQEIEKMLVPMTVNSAENDDEDTTTLATTEDFEDGDFTSDEQHDKYGEV
jgi:muconolactone delta-isomerase